MTALAITYQAAARRVMATAALVCLFAVLAYGAFLLMAVGRAAASQSYQSDAREIRAALSALESEYLAMSGELTLRDAETLGLVAVPAARIVYQRVQSPALSLRR